MGIGENIRLARKTKGVSLEFVAKKIGVSRQTLSRYETGVITNIPSNKIEGIAKILNTTPSFLMGWNTSNKASTDNTSSNFIDIPFIYQKNLKSRKSRCTELADSDIALVYEEDDMIAARIFKGDTILLKKTETIQNSDIVAIMSDETIKLRRVYINENNIELKPEAPSYSSEFISKEDFSKINVIGKAAGFISIIE